MNAYTRACYHGCVLLFVATVWWVAACRSADPESAPVTTSSPAENTSISGCVVELRTEYEGQYAEPGTSCRGAFLDDGNPMPIWPNLSSDCQSDDGGYYRSRSTYDAMGCKTSYNADSVSDGELWESHGSYVCDAHGELLSAIDSWGGTYSDGQEWFIGYETTYANEYDEAGQLTAQEYTELDDNGYSWWSREEWTYEADRVIRWDKDREGESGTSWGGISRIDYEWSADGLLAAERAWWSEGHGDTYVYWYETHTYDDFGREVLTTSDDGENGSIDSEDGFTYVAETTRIDTWAFDLHADGTDEIARAFAYDCP